MGNNNNNIDGQIFLSFVLFTLSLLIIIFIIFIIFSNISDSHSQIGR